MSKKRRVEFIPKNSSIKRIGFLDGEYIYSSDVESDEECRIYSKENVHILEMDESVEKKQTCLVTNFENLMNNINSYLADGYTIDKINQIKDGNSDYFLIVFNLPS